MNNADKTAKPIATAANNRQTDSLISATERKTIIEPWREVHNAVKGPVDLDDVLLQQYQQAQQRGPRMPVFSWRFGLSAGLVAAGLAIVLVSGLVPTLFVPATTNPEVAMSEIEPEQKPARGQSNQLRSTRLESGRPQLGQLTQGLSSLQTRVASLSSTTGARFRPDLARVGRPSIPTLASVTQVTNEAQRRVRTATRPKS